MNEQNPPSLNDAIASAPNILVREALSRVQSTLSKQDWDGFSDKSTAVAKIQAACIFYWESQNLPSNSVYSKDIDELIKKVDALKLAMRTTFGAKDALLTVEFDRYQSILQSQSKAKYEAFYARPRQLLLEQLYGLTDYFFSQPKHSLVATLASAITDATISQTDIQSTHRNLKLAKMPRNK